MISPCMGCEGREVGCHARCEPYQAFRQRLDTINDQKTAEKIIRGARIEAVLRMKKSIERKKP